MGVEGVDKMSQEEYRQAAIDACTPGNPRDVEKSQIVALYKSIL